MVFTKKDAKLATRVTLTQHYHFCGLYGFSEKNSLLEKLLDHPFYCADKNWRAVHLWSTSEICLALQPITAIKTKAKCNRSSVQAAGDGFLWLFSAL